MYVNVCPEASTEPEPAETCALTIDRSVESESESVTKLLVTTFTMTAEASSLIVCDPGDATGASFTGSTVIVTVPVV